MDAATIVVLGDSEPERATLVDQLAMTGLPARPVAQLDLSLGIPALIVVTGAEELTSSRKRGMSSRSRRFRSSPSSHRFPRPP